MATVDTSTGIQPVPKRDWTIIGSVSMQMTEAKTMEPKDILALRTFQRLIRVTELTEKPASMSFNSRNNFRLTPVQLVS